jgi:hypothetical protein
MSRIIPAFQFFYLIETSHFFIHDGRQVHRVGYGITIGPKKRVCQYSDHSGGEQSFQHLYYGSYGQVVSLENIVKEKMKSKTHLIFGEPVEWLSHTSGVSLQDLNNLVLDIIDTESFDIYPIRDKFLPFDNRTVHKRMTNFGVKTNPVKYLDVLEVPGILKAYEDR